jgi:hypothetical protein
MQKTLREMVKNEPCETIELFHIHLSEQIKNLNRLNVKSLDEELDLKEGLYKKLEPAILYCQKRK